MITRFSKHVEVEDNQGNHLRCSIRPNLETLVAGDRVIWQLEGKDQGVVVSLYPRTSLLAKPTNTGIKTRRCEYYTTSHCYCRQTRDILALTR